MTVVVAIIILVSAVGWSGSQLGKGGFCKVVSWRSDFDNG